MPIESDGHSRGNPRLYEVIEHAPKTGKSPTVWAWPNWRTISRLPGSRSKDRGLPTRTRALILKQRASPWQLPTATDPVDGPPSDRSDPRAGARTVRQHSSSEV